MRPRARAPFGRRSRLRTRRDFDAVFQQGRKVVTRALVVWLRPAPPGRPSRLGLSVGRRVGGAPRRNRVKRCLREAFRRLAPDLPESLDVVLIARPAAPPDSLASARQALAQAFATHAARTRAPSRPATRDGARHS